jgi:hypothetical protein
MPPQDAGSHLDDDKAFLRPQRWWSNMLFVNLDGGLELFDPELEHRWWFVRGLPGQVEDEAREPDFLYFDSSRATSKKDQGEKRRRSTNWKDVSDRSVKAQWLWCMVDRRGARYVLWLRGVHVTPDPVPFIDDLGRELSYKDASSWFVLRDINPPLGLPKLVLLHDPSLYPTSRLSPHWAPERSELSEAFGDQNEERKGSPEAPIVLGGAHEEVIVWGQSVGVLPDAQYRVVRALVEAHAAGDRLSITVLSNRTKDDKGNRVEDVVGALRRLLKKGGVWPQVIQMSGEARHGYGLKSAQPAKGKVAAPKQSTNQNPTRHTRRPKGG